MKLAIMQPYLFPYLGYFQLVAAVEKFVFYDDVNFIKNGWINRNRLLFAGRVGYITVPLSGASPFLKIHEIRVYPNDTWRKKILESVRHSYSKAPNFNEVSDLLAEVLLANQSSISELAKQSVTTISKYLGLEVSFVMSSSYYENSSLSGVARVLDICAKEKASQYYNLPGGRGLYESDLFKSNGIDLCFIRPNLNPYKQFSQEFHPGLSILDVLMFNDRNTVREMLFHAEVTL